MVAAEEYPLAQVIDRLIEYRLSFVALRRHCVPHLGAPSLVGRFWVIAEAWEYLLVTAMTLGIGKEGVHLS